MIRKFVRAIKKFIQSSKIVNLRAHSFKRKRPIPATILIIIAIGVQNAERSVGVYRPYVIILITAEIKRRTAMIATPNGLFLLEGV